MILKKAAINIDGVFLKDTFNPVIRQFVENYGGYYSPEFERNCISQPQQKAGAYITAKLGLNMTPEEVVAKFFEVRDEYIKEIPEIPVEGAIKATKMLKDLNLKLVCYGGLKEKYFHEKLGKLTELFDHGYVCTNDFRPGIKEIRDRLNLKSYQILFIDDVARVAATAKKNGVPFIGVPCSPVQKEDMKGLGLKCLLNCNSFGSITEKMVRKVDQKAMNFWA